MRSPEAVNMIELLKEILIELEDKPINLVPHLTELIRAVEIQDAYVSHLESTIMKLRKVL